MNVIPLTPHIPHTISDRPCIDFLNSRWVDPRGSGTVRDDLLQDAEWRRWFLTRWGYATDGFSDSPGMPVVAAARDALRLVLEAWAGRRPIPASALAGVSVAIAGATGRRILDTTGEVPAVRFQPDRRDWGWVVGDLAADAAALMADGDPRRLKSCANTSCTWLFYDESHNLSRRWCDAAACGNLVNVRAHRARRAEASA